MDWNVFHFLNDLFQGHPLVQDEIGDFTASWAVPLFAAMTIGLWFLDRPGPWFRWKVASLGGMTAAGLGLLVSQVISHIWDRPRPFMAHPHDTILLVTRSTEPSFPSDHAVAAFAIAFSVALIGKRMGALFLSVATVIAVFRVIAGVHYPGDVLGGAVIGLVCAFVVMRLAGDYLIPVVRLLSRVSDPLVTPAWRALDRVKDRRRGRAAT
jgi:undecaprenyl-diphosphatase